MANSIFDIFTTETLIAMAFGRYSVMADEDEMMLPWKAAELIVRHRVRLIEFTPSRARLFMENEAFVRSIDGMPVAMMCGEVLPPQLLQELRDAGCRKIFNLYGPTETTVYSTMDDVTRAERITVGKMYPNCRGYVLDESMRPVMPTASGELYFAGECLAAGYVGQEDLTKQAFLPDPFFPGEVMYRSGDIVRLLPDGRIDFLGRRDHQVKLNGQRIELSEITQKMLDSGLTDQAATIVRRDGAFMALRAFVRSHPERPVDLDALRNYLSKELPAYMIPSDFVRLPALPCTPSGKLDYKALEAIRPDQAPLSPPLDHQTPSGPRIPVPAPDGSALPDAFTPPASPAALSDAAPPAQTQSRCEPSIAQTMASIWADTLSRPHPDPDQSFFEQGGTSLSALNLLSQYYHQGLTMSLSEFYDHPTLRGQIEFFNAANKPESRAADENPCFGLPGECLPPPRPDAPAETRRAAHQISSPVEPAASSPVPAPAATESSPPAGEPPLTSSPASRDVAPSLPGSGDLLFELWRQTLSKPSLDPDQSFFEQGGTSLGALSLLSQYYNHGISMTLAEFFEHPTLREQQTLLGLPGGEKGIDPIQNAAEEQTVSGLSSAPADDKKAVLLTGATGFLGSHLLKSLLDAGTPKVYCLVRGGDSARLFDTLGWYFGQGWAAACRSRIEVVGGDIVLPGLGMDPGTSERMARETAFVLHAAADVRHYACDGSAEHTNKEGAAQAAAWARCANARLVHISTVSLCAEHLTGAPDTLREFSEADFDIGQNWQESVYLRGKFEAERLIRREMEQGLDALILRVGRLVGRSSDGVFQKNATSNAFWGLVNGISCLSALSPELADLPMEMTAVDECARAAVLLMRSPGPVYHLFNSHILTVRDILHKLGRPMQELERPLFERHLKERSEAGFGIRLAPLISQYHRLLQAPFRIHPVCKQTETQLEALGFAWREPDPAVLLRAFWDNP